MSGGSAWTATGADGSRGGPAPRSSRQTAPRTSTGAPPPTTARPTTCSGAWNVSRPATSSMRREAHPALRIDHPDLLHASQRRLGIPMNGPTRIARRISRPSGAGSVAAASDSRGSDSPPSAAGRDRRRGPAPRPHPAARRRCPASDRQRPHQHVTDPERIEAKGRLLVRMPVALRPSSGRRRSTRPARWASRLDREAIGHGR